MMKVSTQRGASDTRVWRAKPRLIFASLLLCVFAFSRFQVGAQVGNPIERVVVISLDGARPDAIQQVDAPNLQRYAELGAVNWTAQTVIPSVTLPAHTTMLTGLSVEEHGVDYNNKPLFSCPPIDAPTFLTIAIENGYTAGFVTGKEKFCLFDQTDALDYTFARLGDRSVADVAIELINAGTDVVFAHFPNPDYFGHLLGWMSPTYLYELENTDYEVGRVIEAVDLSNTLVIITADHGGHDAGHGADQAVDTTIPFIMLGAGVQPGTTLEGVSVGDAAATALWALGLPVPESDASRPLIEAFDPAVVEAVMNNE